MFEKVGDLEKFPVFKIGKQELTPGQYTLFRIHISTAQFAVGSQAPFPFTEKVTSLTLIVEQVHLENLWVSLSSTATAVFQGCASMKRKETKNRVRQCPF